VISVNVYNFLYLKNEVVFFFRIYELSLKKKNSFGRGPEERNARDERSVIHVHERESI
jgi:hypothetical protein